MDLTALLPRLRSAKQILVTGPQRSGTTIGARILAQELGLKFYPEESTGPYNLRRTCQLLDQETDFVLQSPGMAAYCHLLGIAVVFMRRDVLDIRRSEDRVRWQVQALEHWKYFSDDGP